MRRRETAWLETFRRKDGPSGQRSEVAAPSSNRWPMPLHRAAGYIFWSPSQIETAREKCHVPQSVRSFASSFFWNESKWSPSIALRDHVQLPLFSFSNCSAARARVIGEVSRLFGSNCGVSC